MASISPRSLASPPLVHLVLLLAHLVFVASLLLFLVREPRLSGRGESGESAARVGGDTEFLWESQRGVARSRRSAQERRGRGHNGAQGVAAVHLKGPGPLIKLVGDGVLKDWDAGSVTHEFRVHTRHGQLEVMRSGLYHVYTQAQVRFKDSTDSAWLELQVDDVTVTRCPLVPAGGTAAPPYQCACYTARALPLAPHQSVRVRVALGGAHDGGGRARLLVHMAPEATFLGAVRLGDAAT